MTRFLALCLLLAPLAACGGDEGGGDGDADADADADGDGDGDGDGDADLCALPGESGVVQLHVQVDSAEVLTCGGSEGDRWRLNVWACGEATAPECADRTGGPCDGDGERALLGNACEHNIFTMPTAGRYTICVEAELVNGFITYEQCSDVEVVIGPEGFTDVIQFDLDAEGVFPCVRDMHFDPDENQCCNFNVGACFSPNM